MTNNWNDEQLQAEIGESEAQARYAEFANKGKMSTQQYSERMAKNLQASARHDWLILFMAMGAAVMFGFTLAAVVIWIIH